MTAFVIENARIIDPASNTDCTGSLVAVDGVIKSVGDSKTSPPKGAKKIDARGVILAPGLIDMRVQSRNPGHAHKETRASLARAAAAGGITALVCLPDTEPVLDDPESLAAMLRPNGHAGGPRLYAYGAATSGLRDEGMAELGLLAEAGAVGFTNGTRTIADPLVMRRVMTYAAMLGKPVIQHAEDPALVAEGEMNEGETSTRLGLRGIPAEAEEIIIARDISLARLTGAHYHVGHISTRRGVDLVRRAKADGIHVTCDTAPPYFMFNDLAVSDYDTRFKLSPPLRSEQDRLAIRDAIADGTIDCIASDHAPHDRDAKLLPFGVAEAGASAVETLAPMMMGLVHDGVVPMMRAIEMVTSAPAHLLGLDCGTLAVGAAADLVLIDPERGWQIRGSEMLSLSAATPFEGQPVQGAVMATWARGEMIHSRDPEAA